jgi:hypothetical protein
MCGFSRFIIPFTRIVALVGALSSYAPSPASAATVLSETFDYTGSSAALFSFSVPGAGTLTFTLSLPAPTGGTVSGGFTAIITDPSLNMLFTVFDGEVYDQSTRNLGVASFPGSLFNDPALPDDPHVLNGAITWSAIAVAGGYSIDIFSALVPSFGGFAPGIRVDFEASVSPTPVPVPGAFPLFASGAIMLWLMRRRHCRNTLLVSSSDRTMADCA